MPDEEVHRFINDLERSSSTYLYGRRMNETMIGWESDPTLAAASPIMREFAEIWQSANKLVFSKSLATVSTSRTQLVREFNPQAVSQMKEAAGSAMLIGGPALATHAFRAGLVDECHLFLVPVIVGGGKRAIPDRLHLELELVDERRFDSGTLFLRYRVRPQRAT